MSLVTIDFETYSEAGYYQGSDGKWRGLVKTGPGLPAVGAPAYAEHPSTRVLCLAYDLLDGYGPRLWAPGMEPPTDLFAYIQTGGLIESHNAGFEFWIWHHVCAGRMGWPALPAAQQRCSMAKCRAHSLPGKLEKAGEVLGAAEQKDKAGTALLRKLSVPGKKTTTGDYDALYRYCLQDIRSEAHISALCPELSEFETAVWLLDQRINIRGMAIDTASLDLCISAVNRTTEVFTGELRDITGGAVQSVGELAKLTTWLSSRGLHTNSLEADRVDELLARSDVQGDVRRILEIRSALGAASVKKLFAIERRLTRDGRLHDLFAYCGADRTGRWAGRGPQPQNLPGGAPVEKVDEVLAGLPGRAAALDVIEDVSSCLRGLFVAAPGHDLLCADFSAIEAVVLAELAGETWRQEVFRTHGKIYEMSASLLTGTPLEEYLEHKRTTGDHHPHRKRGKVAELACFGEDTKVLTNSGWKRIVDVLPTDLLHDGVDWVRHGGVVDKGNRLTIKMGGVTVTPDHKFFAGGDKWVTAESLSESTKLQRRALCLASSLLLANVEKPTGVYSGTPVLAHVVVRVCTNRVTCGSGSLHAATSALKRNPPRQIHNTVKRALICGIVRDYSIVCRRRSGGAMIPRTGSTQTTGGEGSPYGRSGWMTEKSGCGICAVYQDGMIRLQRSTGRTTIKAMSPATSGLLRIVNNSRIKYKRFGWSTVGSKCPRLSFIGTSAPGMRTPTRSVENFEKVIPPNRLSSSKLNVEAGTTKVYDILDCGPRSRFIMMTADGPMIAHNSGYGGGLGAWKAFGADAFMTDEEIQEAVRAWRSASPNIVRFWYGLQDAALSAISTPGYCYSYRSITYGVQDDILYCLLPSGRRLTYHRPRVHQKIMPWGKETTCITYMGWNSNYLNGPVGWMRLETYGPKLAENVVQAVSRDILANSMLSLDAAGYPIVLHVHDEVVAEVPHDFGSVEAFEEIMGRMPEWAAGWPVRAAGGWRGRRYRKE